MIQLTWQSHQYFLRYSSSKFVLRFSLPRDPFSNLNRDGYQSIIWVSMWFDCSWQLEIFGSSSPPLFLEPSEISQVTKEISPLPPKFWAALSYHCDMKPRGWGLDLKCLTLLSIDLLSKSCNILSLRKMVNSIIHDK